MVPVGGSTLAPLPTTGCTAWLDWARWAQVLLGAAVVILAWCAARYTRDPEKNSGAADFMLVIAASFFITEILLILVHLYREFAEHHSGQATSAWEAFCAALVWLGAGTIFNEAEIAGTRAETSRTGAGEASLAAARLRQYRWFSNASATPPAFLDALFDIKALRCFELSATESAELSYVLVAGTAVVLVGRLGDAAQRPRLGALAHSWASTLGVPASSVRIILIAPGFVPPLVSASDYFEMQSIITTEAGIKDVIGPWLESDSRLCVSVLQQLLTRLAESGDVLQSPILSHR